MLAFSGLLVAARERPRWKALVPGACLAFWLCALMIDELASGWRHTMPANPRLWGAGEIAVMLAMALPFGICVFGEAMAARRITSRTARWLAVVGVATVITVLLRPTLMHWAQLVLRGGA